MLIFDKYGFKISPIIEDFDYNDNLISITIDESDEKFVFNRWEAQYNIMNVFAVYNHYFKGKKLITIKREIFKEYLEKCYLDKINTIQITDLFNTLNKECQNLKSSYYIKYYYIQPPEDIYTYFSLVCTIGG